MSREIKTLRFVFHFRDQQALNKFSPSSIKTFLCKLNPSNICKSNSEFFSNDIKMGQRDKKKSEIILLISMLTITFFPSLQMPGQLLIGYPKLPETLHGLLALFAVLSYYLNTSMDILPFFYSFQLKCFL